MKNIIYIAFALSLVACNNSSEKKSTKPLEETQKSTQKAQPSKPKSGTDYSTLLSDFECNIGIAELAQVLQVSESDISIPDDKVTTIYNTCLFRLEGFGKSTLGDGTQLLFGPYPSTKAQNKKEIAEYLERKEAGLKIMGMDIELAETGNSYIAYQPAHGRVLILNENQGDFFLINYGQRNSNTNRTKEQHESLRLKMRDLANYLLKKYKK